MRSLVGADCSPWNGAQGLRHTVRPVPVVRPASRPERRMPGELEATPTVPELHAFS
jgi:hypothetical protein